MPAIGLVPVLAATVLAAQGMFNPRPTTPPEAGAPTLIATPTSPAVASQSSGTQPTAVTQPTVGPILTQAAAAAQPTPAASPQSAAPQTPPRTALETTVSNEPFIAYRVQPGDTVRFVAQMYGVSPASIAQASGLRNPDLLRIGQVLTVPAQPGWLYRIQPGETLDQIAARTGVAGDVIVSASGLTAASVRVGDVILIPDASLAQSK